MINMAGKILNKNGIGREEIELVRGKMEDLKLPIDKVDIVVSEWMGYGLLYETMLPSVLNARDRYMNEGGTMWPNKCQMYLEGCCDQRMGYWDNVYGIDMGDMKEQAMRELCKEAVVEVFDESNVATDRMAFWECDLNKVKDEELDFDREFGVGLQGEESKLINCFLVR